MPLKLKLGSVIVGHGPINRRHMEVKDFGRKGAKGIKKNEFSFEKKVEGLREAGQSGKSIQGVC